MEDVLPVNSLLPKQWQSFILLDPEYGLFQCFSNYVRTHNLDSPYISYENFLKTLNLFQWNKKIILNKPPNNHSLDYLSDILINQGYAGELSAHIGNCVNVLVAEY